MKYLLKILSVLALVFLVSCGSRKPQAMPEPIVLTETKEIKEIVRDTIFKIEKDSAFYKAYIDCKDGVPKLVNPQSKGGKSLKPPNVEIDKQGKLNIKSEKEAEDIPVQWKEKIVIQTIPKVVYKDKIIYQNKPLKWYETLLIYSGIIFWGLLITIISIVIARIFKR